MSQELEIRNVLLAIQDFREDTARTLGRIEGLAAADVRALEEHTTQDYRQFQTLEKRLKSLEINKAVAERAGSKAGRGTALKVSTAIIAVVELVRRLVG